MLKSVFLLFGTTTYYPYLKRSFGLFLAFGADFFLDLDFGLDLTLLDLLDGFLPFLEAIIINVLI